MDSGVVRPHVRAVRPAARAFDARRALDHDREVRRERFGVAGPLIESVERDIGHDEQGRKIIAVLRERIVQGTRGIQRHVGIQRRADGFGRPRAFQCLGNVGSDFKEAVPLGHDVGRTVPG